MNLNQVTIPSLDVEKAVGFYKKFTQLPEDKSWLWREAHLTDLGEKWVSDVTYIKIANEWNYLTTILDLADKSIVVWFSSDYMTTNNTKFIDSPLKVV